MKAVELIKLKLPRDVEVDPLYEKLQRFLVQDLRPLWAKSSLKVPHIQFLPGFEEALKSAVHYREVERGLERIEVLLKAEEKGLRASRQKLQTPTPNRVSRLLVVADGGSERFYRQCESLLLQNADRVMCLRVESPSTVFAQKLFGDEERVIALLVSDRNSVTNVLLSLVEK